MVFPSAVELVTVDAVVTDKKNVPIENLTRDKFQVYEDGKLQSIASFEAVVLPATQTPPPKRTRMISSNQVVESRTGRTFVIVFDDVHLQPFQANRAKAAIDQFLKNGTRNGDRVTLLASGGGAWWSTRMPEGYGELSALLKRLEGREIPDIGNDRVTEAEALRIHIYRDNLVADRVARRFDTYGVNPMGSRTDTATTGLATDGDPMVYGRAAEVYYQAAAKNKITLQAMERALNALGGSRGRKSMILVGQGFIYDPNLPEFKDVVEASRRSNCAVYFVDTMGLGGMPVAMTAQYGPSLDPQDYSAAFAENFDRSEGAESIASDSGGFTVKNSNDLVKGLERIADETRVYYLIGYNPTNTARDGKFRKIELKVDGKDMRVRARKGYYAPLDGEAMLAAAKKKPEAGPDPGFQEALDSPYAVTDIPIRMTSYVFDETLLGKASAIIHADIDLSAFALDQEEGRFKDTLDFLLVVAHRETGEFNRYDQKIEMNLRPETRDKFLKTWFPIQRDFELLPGAYQAKIVVRDKNSSKFGTVVHDFEVPDLASWRLSTPVLTDTLQPVVPGQENAPPKLVLLARRDFVTGSRLYCQFDVYNATKDKATGMPNVTAGLTIRRKSDGFVFIRITPTRIQPTSLGRLTRIVGPSLEGAAPGEYEFNLYLKDELSGKIMEFEEDITILPDTARMASGSN